MMFKTAILRLQYLLTINFVQFFMDYPVVRNFIDLYLWPNSSLLNLDHCMKDRDAHVYTMTVLSHVNDCNVKR